MRSIHRGTLLPNSIRRLFYLNMIIPDALVNIKFKELKMITCLNYITQLHENVVLQQDDNIERFDKYQSLKN